METKKIANIFEHLCGDELNIMINFLPLNDIFLIRLLNKYYRRFIDKELKLENYIHNEVNAGIIKKHGKYLQKIVTHSVSLTDENLKHCGNLKELYSPFSCLITDIGLKYIPNIQILCLKHNQNITDEGLKCIPHIIKLDLFCCEKITDDGLRYIPNVQKLILARDNNIKKDELKYISNTKRIRSFRHQNCF